MGKATKSRHKAEDFDLLALRRILEKNGSHSLSVVSDSMEPLIKVGERITLALPQKEELKVFDVILFDQANRLNCHFVTRINHQKDSYTTRSLKFPHSQDYPIKWEQIIAFIPAKKLNWFHKLKVIWAEIRA